VTRLRRLAAPAPLLLALIIVLGLLLRLWHNDYGLPFVWGIDEGTHFANRSVDMFRQGFDPGYYQNPAAYTYLVYGVLRAMYGPLGVHLPFGNVSDQFNLDPTQIWVTARSVAAVLCMFGVAATYFAARRIWGVRHGLVAAALLAFAFLPVSYSRVAVTDVGSLLGVALALWGSVRAAERGRTGDYLVAGAGAGLGLGFKYTAGLALLPLGIAAASRLRADRWRALLHLGAGVLLAVLVFAALNPYLFSHFGRFWDDLRGQAEVAANEPKPGQQSGGVGYYLESLTWGLGWAGAIAAAAGAVLVLRRNLVRGLILVAMPLALFVYLSVQSRYFGRWLLPAYPALAMLGAVALVRVSELVPRRPVVRVAALAALTALVLAQPLAADVRTGLVLGRQDTREQVRNFLAHRFPAELRVSVEPAVPGRWYRSTPVGRNPPWLRRCPKRPGWTEPGWLYPSAAGRVCAQYKPGQFARPDGGVRASAYHLVLRPRVVDDYRFYGYCLVVTFGVVSDRALDTRDPEVAAYYRRLRRDAVLVREFSPYDPGAAPVPFNFDLSYNYYPLAYNRPGPVARVYRLRHCRQDYGAPIVKVPRARELPPFAPRRNEPGTPQDEI
jgi:hypothetical protein